MLYSETKKTTAVSQFSGNTITLFASFSLFFFFFFSFFYFLRAHKLFFIRVFYSTPNYTLMKWKFNNHFYTIVSIWSKLIYTHYTLCYTDNVLLYETMNMCISLMRMVLSFSCSNNNKRLTFSSYSAIIYCVYVCYAHIGHDQVYFACDFVLRFYNFSVCFVSFSVSSSTSPL